MIARRSSALLSMTIALLPTLPWVAEGQALPPIASETQPDEFLAKITELETLHGGRLGVAAIHLADGRVFSHRNDERFAMCSTFKFLLAAAVAARVDAGQLQWTQEIPYSAADLLEYAPITSKPENVNSGSMTVDELCAATVSLSDNTAANVLLRTLGGPKALTQFLRSTGDRVTRLDRNEPGLNTNLPNDPRDTSTPAAMLRTMKNLLTGEMLSAASRTQLTTWLVDCSTGDHRLRAGIGPGWRVGDKTGTGPNGAANDIAIAWPAGEKQPILIVVFFTGSIATPKERDAIIASVGRIVRETLQP